MTKTKILYAEDEFFLAKIVKDSLESRNFMVLHIDEGIHVIPGFQQFKPAICVLDVMLPRIDGFTLGKKIRTIDPHVPILYLTAKNQTQDLLKGFQSGGNDYIRKPFSMEELIVRIDNLLAITQGELNNTKTMTKATPDLGNYQFYPKKYILQHGTHIQKLTHRDMQILNVLVEYKNLSVTRREILQRVWGADHFFNSRNLDVYIYKLRGYFKQDSSVKIVTLKGVGYQLAVE